MTPLYLLIRRFLTTLPSGKKPNMFMCIAIAGMSIAVASNVIVLSLYDGSKQYIHQKILHFGPHMYVYWNQKTSGQDKKHVLKTLNQDPEVEQFTLFYAKKAQLSQANEHRMVTVFGFEKEDLYRRFEPLRYIGEVIPKKNKVVVGKGLLKYFKPKSKTTLHFNHKVIDISCKGALETGFYEGDEMYLYMHKEWLKKAGAQEKGTYVWLNDPFNVNKIIQNYQSKKMITRSWISLNKSLFSSLMMQKWVTSIWLGVTAILAMFFLIVSLMMMIKTKEKQWGILITLGVRKSLLIRMISAISLVLTGVGCFIGFVIGFLALKVLNPSMNMILKWTHQGHRLEDLFLIDHIPIVISPVKWLILGLIAVILAVLASVWPAIRLSKIDPVKAMAQQP